MFEVGVVDHFDAVHQLHGNFGPATQIHGHSYRVDVTAIGPSLQPNGTLCDIAHLQHVLHEVLASLHQRNLEEVDGLRGKNTTAEVVARYLYQQIAPRILEDHLQRLRVRVWETPQAFAAYEGALGGPRGKA